MFIHSPINKNKKVKPNVRRKKKNGKSKKNAVNHSSNKNLVFSPNTKKSDKKYGTYAKEEKSQSLNLKWPKLKPWKIIVGSIIFAAAGLLYINHVFQTQRLLKEVDHLKQNYVKTRRIYQDRKFTYDRMTGPAEIYYKAKKLGLINGGPADKVIIIKKP